MSISARHVKLIVGAIALAIALVACSTPQQTILTHTNYYVHSLNDYERVCVTERTASDCDAYYSALVEYKQRLVNASEASDRGGSFKPQLRDLKDSKHRIEQISGKRL